MFQPNDQPVPGYRIERILGRGGFGEVWQALGPGRTPAALKFIGLNGRPGFREFRAIQRVKEIRHAHLLPMHGLWILDTQNQLIDDETLEQLEQMDLPDASKKTEAVAGPSTLVVAMMLADISLIDLLTRYKALGAAGVPPLELLRYMEDSARGIDYLNRRKHDLGNGRVSVQHCDIKPHNIVLVGDSAMVCDFGLARVLDESQITSGVSGTPVYMAPEIIQGKPPSDSTDQYSLALTYYHLRTGQITFPSNIGPLDMMSSHAKGDLDLSRVSGEELRVLKRATSLDTDSRYGTTLEMVHELQQCCFESTGDVFSSAVLDSAMNTMTDAEVQASHGSDRNAVDSVKDSQSGDAGPKQVEEAETALGVDVRLALMGATAAMKQTNWPFMTTIHLWIGLSYIANGVLATAMRGRGVDPSQARRAMRKVIHRDQKVEDSTESQLSDNVESVILKARDRARSDGSRRVREIHLLQAILAKPDSAASMILDKFGIDQDQLVEHDQLVENDEPRESRSRASSSRESALRSSLRSSKSRASLNSGAGSRRLDRLDVISPHGNVDLSLFDDQCRAAFNHCCEICRRLGQSEIRTPHLFLGILQRRDSQLAARLRRNGIDVVQLQEKLGEILPDSSLEEFVDVQLHRDFFSRNALGALQKASQIAAQNGLAAVTEAELISALLEGVSIVALTLQRCGVERRFVLP